MVLDLRKNNNRKLYPENNKEIDLITENDQLNKELLELKRLLKNQKENSLIYKKKTEEKLSEINQKNNNLKKIIRENKKTISIYTKNEKIYQYNEKVHLENEDEYERIIKLLKIKEKKLQNKIVSLTSDLLRINEELKKIKKLKWYNKILGI